MTSTSIRLPFPCRFTGGIAFFCIPLLLFPSVVPCATATDVSIHDGGGVTSYRNHLPPDNEVHVIGVYETMSRGFRQHPVGKPQVDIVYNQSEMMRPITLVLSSYEANEWQLNIDPRASVEKIVLNGYYDQTVVGAGDIPVVTSFNAGTYPHTWPFSTGGSSTQQLLVAVEDLLGTRVSSFTGSYRASRFTVTGSPENQQTINPRLGAGNLIDGPNPDLIYDARTGEVQIDLNDLAARYPVGSGDIWWQYFYAQRLFVTLANHDGTFDVDGFDPTDINRIGIFRGDPALNENRLGYDSASLRYWRGGEVLSLGEIFPSGIADVSSLQQYLSAASFGTDREQGEFDLIYVVPEPSALTLLGFCWLLIGASRRVRGIFSKVTSCQELRTATSRLARFFGHKLAPFPPRCSCTY